MTRRLPVLLLLLLLPLLTSCEALFGPRACTLIAFTDGVTVRLTTASGTRTESFRPPYTEHQPNGPGCGPVCRQAAVTMALPR